MPSPVYSTQFIARAGLNVNVGYTVPAGYRAVLRDVDVACATGSGDTRIFFLENPQGGLVWVAIANPESYVSFQWRGRQVYNPGEIITFNPAEGAWDVMGSGYLLTLP